MAAIGRFDALILQQGAKLGDAQIPPDGPAVAELLSQGRPFSATTNAARYVQALWLLLGQSISDTEPEHVRGTARRGGQRAGLPPKVSVVRLRPSKASQRNGESTVAWTHRWVVRGSGAGNPTGWALG